MKLVSMLVALVIVLFLVLGYMKRLKRDVEMVRPSSPDSTGYIDKAREAVGALNEASDRALREAEKALGK